MLIFTRFWQRPSQKIVFQCFVEAKIQALHASIDQVRRCKSNESFSVTTRCFFQASPDEVEAVLAELATVLLELAEPAPVLLELVVTVLVQLVAPPLAALRQLLPARCKRVCPVGCVCVCVCAQA